MRSLAPLTLVLVLPLASACDDDGVPGPDGDSGTAPGLDAGADAGARDAAPLADGGGALQPGFEHCPAPSAYVGDATWPGHLTTGGALLCAYPRRDVAPRDALAQKRRIQLVPGTFAYPFAATDAPFRLPACFERTGATNPPEILAGTVDAERREDFFIGGERYLVTADLTVAGTSTTFRVALSAPVDAPDLDLSGAAIEFNQVSAALCTTAGCRDPDEIAFWPCRFASNTCDELTLQNGSLAVDQFHWAGQVGSGFAAGLRVRGTLDGTAFDIDDYARIQITYGHHAFTRGLLVFFAAPIGATCGLEIEEIAEGAPLTDAHLLDCAGNRIGTRPITGAHHRWREPCP